MPSRIPVVLFVLGTACTAWAATLTVDDDGPADFSSIQAALDAAGPGDTIEVAAGIYSENIQLKNGVRVIGAGADRTTIDGGRRGPVAVLQDCDAATSFQGFTITNGEADFGGGVRVEGGAPLITLNHITGNSVLRAGGSGGRGGGIALLDTDARVLENQIEGNAAEPNPDTGWGGGVFIRDGAPLLRGNEILNNTTSRWGAGVNIVSGEVRLDANTISGNNAGDYGGGVSVEGPATAMISNNLIVGNRALTESGGVDVDAGSSGVLINNTFAHNESSLGGGVFLIAAYSTTSTLTNNVFFGNSASDTGGGVAFWVTETSTVELRNNHFFTNSPNFCQGFRISEFFPGGITPDDTLCEDEMNLFSDPMFVNPGGFDYRLRADSPAIDSGRPEGIPARDFRGQRRPLDGNADGTALPDRGAHEFDHNDVLGLRFEDPHTLTWDAAPGAGSYHVYSADPLAILDGSPPVPEICRDADDPDRTDTSFTETLTPEPGHCFAYIATAVIDSSEQTAGFNSAGLERPLTLPCP